MPAEITEALDGETPALVTAAGARVVVGTRQGELFVLSAEGNLLSGPVTLPATPVLADAGSGNTPLAGAEGTVFLLSDTVCCDATSTLIRYVVGSSEAEWVDVSGGLPLVDGGRTSSYGVPAIVADGHDGVWLPGNSPSQVVAYRYRWADGVVDRFVDLSPHLPVTAAGRLLTTGALRDGVLRVGTESGVVTAIDTASGDVVETTEPQGEGALTDMLTYPGGLAFVARSDGTVTSSSPLASTDGPTRRTVPGTVPSFRRSDARGGVACPGRDRRWRVRNSNVHRASRRPTVDR